MKAYNLFLNFGCLVYKYAGLNLTKGYKTSEVIPWKVYTNSFWNYFVVYRCFDLRKIFVLPGMVFCTPDLLFLFDPEYTYWTLGMHLYLSVQMSADSIFDLRCCVRFLSSYSIDHWNVVTFLLSAGHIHRYYYYRLTEPESVHHGL